MLNGKIRNNHIMNTNSMALRARAIRKQEAQVKRS
jgi:hypothetical protein